MLVISKRDVGFYEKHYQSMTVNYGIYEKAYIVPHLGLAYVPQ